MIKKLILCIAGFLLCLPLFSQETILLKGKVFTDSLNEVSINIINITQKTGTTNGASGEFEIRVRKNDTLIFSSIQYSVVEIIITQKVLENKFLNINLSEKINELEEVHLSSINLTGNLSQDLKDLEVFSQAEIGFPFSTRPAPTYMQRQMSAARGSSLEFLLNTLNGRIKMLKKAEELMKFDVLVEKGVEAVSTDYFVDHLLIPKEEIINFVNFCAEGVEYRNILTKGDHLKLMEYYFSKAPDFLKSLR